DDRTEAMFLVRMVESRRDKLRLEVVDDVRSITRKYGFTPRFVGGIYYLQGRLAKLVASSLVTGLFWLNLLFVIIAWIVARSVRGALAWNCLFRCDHWRRVRDIRFVGISSNPTLRFGSACWFACGHRGQLVRAAASRGWGVEKEVGRKII